MQERNMQIMKQWYQDSKKTQHDVIINCHALKQECLKTFLFQCMIINNVAALW